MRLTVPTFSALVLVCAAACAPAASDSDSASVPAPAPDSTPARLTPPTAATPVADTRKPTPDIELGTDKVRYHAGDSVSLIVINKTGTRFAFNPCPRVVERQVKRAGGTDWMPIAEPPRRCATEALILKALEARIAKTALPKALDAGSVRIVVPMTKEGMPIDSASVAAITRVLTIDP